MLAPRSEAASAPAAKWATRAAAGGVAPGRFGIEQLDVAQWQRGEYPFGERLHESCVPGDYIVDGAAKTLRG